MPQASSMSWRAALTVLACLLALCAAGCGSSGQGSTLTSQHGASQHGASQHGASPLLSLRLCLRRHGYSISPESLADLGTAPRRFQFVAIWQVLNPSRVALALTFSRDTAGAKRAAAWTRRENAKIGRGVVLAPVVRIGKVDVLWTATPGVHNINAVYGCVRANA
jgi:hypothetical protein